MLPRLEGKAEYKAKLLITKAANVLEARGIEHADVETMVDESANRLTKALADRSNR